MPLVTPVFSFTLSFNVVETFCISFLLDAMSVVAVRNLFEMVWANEASLFKASANSFRVFNCSGVPFIMSENVLFSWVST